MASVTAFYTNSEDSINQKIIDVAKEPTYENIDEVYEIERCVNWIVKSGYARVALQFPDELMQDAVNLTDKLQKAVNSQTTVFILGDTSYGSCCVDEVAAQHFNADAIIHYGRSCLSQPCKMPTLFVFGRQPMDVSHCTDQIQSFIADPSTSIILICDTVYTYASEASERLYMWEKVHIRFNPFPHTRRKQTAANKFEKRIWTAFDNEKQILKRFEKIRAKGEIAHYELHPLATATEVSENVSIISDIETAVKKIYPNLVISKLYLSVDDKVDDIPESNVLIRKCGRSLIIPADKTLKDYTVLFIGKESLTLTNISYNFQPKEMYSYNPETKVCRKESVNVNKLLMKRYFLIEKAKDANIVGILVGTLGVANYGEVLNRLKTMIKKAGKKSYVFIVGKINVAKLANFMEIDIFVLIACSENTLLDSSEFYKPVITPYEMEIACNLREWTGDYQTDFNCLLNGGSEYVPIPDKIDQDETDISLVTGKMRHLGSTENGVETGSAVVLRSDNFTVATQAETAGQFLEMRSWKGLEQHLGETPVTKAVEGQKGIAMGYTNEPGKENG